MGEWEVRDCRGGGGGQRVSRGRGRSDSVEREGKEREEIGGSVWDREIKLVYWVSRKDFVGELSECGGGGEGKESGGREWNREMGFVSVCG